MSQYVRFYKGYRLEMTPWGVDVSDRTYGELRSYVLFKVSLKEAIRYIRHNPLP